MIFHSFSQGGFPRSRSRAWEKESNVNSLLGGDQSKHWEWSVRCGEVRWKGRWTQRAALLFSNHYGWMELNSAWEWWEPAWNKCALQCYPTWGWGGGGIHAPKCCQALAESCSQGALIPQYFWTALCVDGLWFQERTLRRRVIELPAGGGAWDP